MGSYDVFIRRPILTLMLTLSLIVFGVLGYQRLGVDQFPDMDFPIVTVSAQMEGASPEVIEQDVTDVLEEHLNTIAGVRQLRSKSYHGTSVITVEFELGRDIDIAAQDVRDKVARARYQLPEDVEPPVVDKEDFGDEPVLWVPVNSDRPLVEASEYVRHFMKPRLETIQGVASVVLFGERERAIRIWLDGEQLRARGLAATDILDAVRREHVELPGGEVESDRVEYSVKTDAEFRTVAELQRLIIAYVDGAPVRLQDVARVEDGAADPRTVAHFDGIPTVGIGIRKQSGANTVSVVDETYRRLDEMRPLLPAGYSFKGNDAAADFSKAIRESVAETQFALVFGAVLAVLTVFVFLRRTRPTLIVAAAIPISLIATFGVMWLFDYTLNTMTLLALALAVGVVIDDAIVVLENIERHREQGEEPFEAASKGTREIAFAATASTVSIAVVFMPVIFVEGLVGSFLAEFGVTVAASVMASLVVALTLTPMLAARMPAPKPREHGSIYHRLEQGFTWIETHYRSLIDWAFLHRKTTLGIAVASFALALVLGRTLGAEFFPPSDNGMFFVRFTTPPGTTLETTREFLRRNEEWMLQQPELAGMFAGVGIGERRQGGSSNEGMIFAILKSKKDRERTTQELVPLAREALAQIPGQQARVFDLSNMIGNVSGGDFSFEIRGNVDLLELDELSDRFVAELQKRGGYYDLDKSLEARASRGAGAARPGEGRRARRGCALARHDHPGDDRRTRHRHLQGRGPALRHPRAPGGRRAQRSGLDRAALRANARRRRGRAAQPGEDRGRRRAVGDLADRPPAQRDGERQPRGQGARHRGGRSARDRGRDPPGGRLARALRPGRGLPGGHGGLRALARARHSRDLHGARRAVREPEPSPDRDAGAAARAGGRLRRALREGNDDQSLQPDRDDPAHGPGHEELDPADRLREPAARRGHGQGGGDAARGADPHAAGA